MHHPGRKAQLTFLKRQGGDLSTDYRLNPRLAVANEHLVKTLETIKLHITQPQAVQIRHSCVSSLVSVPSISHSLLHVVSDK